MNESVCKGGRGSGGGGGRGRELVGMKEGDCLVPVRLF